jgi:predicted nucleotidyltransferase
MDRDLLERLRRAAAARFSAHGILAAYAHGSRVAGRPRPSSDLDVGYYRKTAAGREALPIAEEMLLAADLSRDVGCEVDLRYLGNAPLELRGRVLEEGVRIYSGDDVERVGLECDTLSRYHDYKDVFRAMHELRLRRIAERGLLPASSSGPDQR